MKNTISIKIDKSLTSPGNANEAMYSVEIGTLKVIRPRLDSEDIARLIL
ncbi:hypothetical protein ACFLUZ_02835 [Chloroflexota bacterium]